MLPDFYSGATGLSGCSLRDFLSGAYTYAGFEGESELLEALYKRGMTGEQIAPTLYRQPGFLMYWSHELVAPWQTNEWLEQMRSQLRPNAFLRMIENRWVSTESSFVPIEWFDACVNSDLSPSVANYSVAVYAGVDASVKRDSTAIVVCTFDRETQKVRLLWHRIFQPTPDDPLDFAATVESSLLELGKRFDLREVRFDPYQLIAVAQRLSAGGLRMTEVPQTIANLTEASSNLYELIKGRNLVVYPDEDVRLAITRCVALETSRGWRIAKEKTSHKIDIVIALAMAALGATKSGQNRDGVMDHIRGENARYDRMRGFEGLPSSLFLPVYCANKACGKFIAPDTPMTVARVENSAA